MPALPCTAEAPECMESLNPFTSGVYKASLHFTAVSERLNNKLQTSRRRHISVAIKHLVSNTIMFSKITEDMKELLMWAVSMVITTSEATTEIL